MVRCAITDALHLSRDMKAQRDVLLKSAERWAVDGIELVQLRQKHVEPGGLLGLAEEMLSAVRSQANSRTKLLVNGRADVAVAARADGVHLTSHPGELTPEQVRWLFAHAGLPKPILSMSCHTLDDVQRARAGAVDYILFGPVFEKRVGGELVTGGTGLELLREACHFAQSITVLALGGVTPANASSCLAAGASGVAGIRIFLDPAESPQANQQPFL